MPKMRLLVIEDNPARGLKKGDTITVNRANRAIWRRRTWVREIKQERNEEYAVTGPAEYAATRTAGPRPLGGGWYELADGSRVRGREAAEAAAEDRDPGHST